MRARVFTHAPGAFTLVEIMVGAALALLVMGAIASLLVVGRRTGAAATSSYIVGRAVDEAVRVLREDLQGAPLNSIRIDRSPPTLSFRSASPLGGGPMTLSRFGAPAWKKTVFYGLRYERGQATGRLVRWEAARPDPIPGAETSAPVPPEGVRTVLTNVVAPGASAPGMPVDPAWGGFHPAFVRQTGTYGSGTETLSDRNPAVFTAEPGKPDRLEGNTRLLQVQLQILQDTGAGGQDFYSLEFRVAPRY